MSGQSQIVGSTLGVAHLASVNGSGQLSVNDSAVASALSGTLAVAGAFYPATQPVSGTFFQATQPVSIAGSVAVADSAVASALGGTLAVADSAVASALSGTLSVSAPAISTTSAVQKNAVSVTNSSTESTTALDLNAVKQVAVFGNLNDTTGAIKVKVSRDNITYYENDEASIYINSSGDFYKTIPVDARYVIFTYTNSSGSTKVLSLNTSYKS